MPNNNIDWSKVDLDNLDEIIGVDDIDSKE
jgi:6-phosphogluconolactonase/glucosamine-6-phosphate isomerase/deaminase